jgi:hypothetical protein
MAIMALAYSNILLTTTTAYNQTKPAGIADQKEFNTVEFFPPETNNTMVKGIMLNGRKYANKLYTHLIYKAVISSNELDEAGVAFIQAFFRSNYKYIVDDLASGNYIEVISSDDKLTPAYLENLVFLPEFTLNLEAVNKEA